MKMRILSVGGIVLTLGILLSSLLAAPSAADAWSWPWWKYAHAEENATSTVAVTIQKYIDGSRATASSSDSMSFPMTASWDSNGEGSGTYALNVGNSFEAKTSQMVKGSDYSTHELFDSSTVGASCADGKPFALGGYSTGSTLNAAKSGTKSTTSPAFTNLTDDAYVIVWNTSCDGAGTTTPNQIVGEVTGGTPNDEPGALAVTSIQAQKTTAVANGTFTDGWKYVFNITVPTDEPDLAMKFDNWLHSNATNTIPVANNMRISSDQTATSSSPVVLTAANTYSSPLITMVDDLDSEQDGLQVQVLVEVAVPAGSLNGTYSTSYGVRSE